MKLWKLSLCYDENNTQELELFDTFEFFNGYLKIKRNYFEKLIKAVNMTKKYRIERGISKVINPENEDWTMNPWMCFLVKDDEKQNPFWLLIKREKDLSGILVAIGPKQFRDYNASINSEAKRELKRLINFIIIHLNKFNCLILIPNFVAS
ncbi:MAG: hypothetical protein EU531_06370 [Promethearchaeota archaeon]|nr:MAG: hypothetical protein EU531_06370 [Candidatus Lokiarchaeota archaeon]